MNAGCMMGGMYLRIHDGKYVLVNAGCMAERLKTQLLETDKMVDLVAGPGKREKCSLQPAQGEPVCLYIV